MTTILMPVEVLDEGCKTCVDFEIETIQETALYAGEECIALDIRLQCMNLEKCKRLQKKFEKKGDIS